MLMYMLRLLKRWSVYVVNNIWLSFRWKKSPTTRQWKIILPAPCYRGRLRAPQEVSRWLSGTAVQTWGAEERWRILAKLGPQHEKLPEPRSPRRVPQAVTCASVRPLVSSGCGDAGGPIWRTEPHPSLWEPQQHPFRRGDRDRPTPGSLETREEHASRADA